MESSELSVCQIIEEMMCLGVKAFSLVNHPSVSSEAGLSGWQMTAMSLLQQAWCLDGTMAILPLALTKSSPGGD